MPHRTASAAIAALILAATAPTARAQEAAARALVPFTSERELAGVLREAAAEEERRRVPPCYRPPTVFTKLPPRPPASSPPDSVAVIRGRVRVHGATGRAGQGIVGANAYVSSLGLSTRAGDDGAFELRAPAARLTGSDTAMLRIRAVGFRPESVLVAPRAATVVHVEISLCPDVISLSAVTLTAAAPGVSITNTQHEGVDEGGIVKRHGDHLVVLRRGRLFTVNVGSGRLRPVAAVDAFGPGIDPEHTWYDELLVVGDRVVVIGYSYERGGTELGVFHISPTGTLRHLGTYQLRSDDYFSSRNYASRLVGTRLVLYAPLDVGADTANPLASLPAMRRWRPVEEARSRRPGSRDTSFRRTLSATRVYRPAGDVDPASITTLHSVTSCDLAAPELNCESSVVLGVESRVFYVSPTAVYVLTAGWDPDSGTTGRRATLSMLYRLPLAGGAPTALRTSGSPIDQFSFLEDGDDLHVLLRHDGSGGPGDGMWRAERGGGLLSLLQVPLASFGDGTMAAPPGAYRPLPRPTSDLPIQNRFAGRHLLYGTGSTWGQPGGDPQVVFVAPLGGGRVVRLRVPHGVERIEPLGSDALVVGADTADLHFAAVRLDGTPRLAQRFVLRQASQGELRSHGFFYRPDPNARGGTFGLPVARAGRPGFEHLFEESAAVLFVRNERGAFRRLGELEARPERAVDDDCRASCVDWYGNARPLFVDGRVFALLGYELVEGRVNGTRIVEARRITFAPRTRRASR